MLDPKKPRILVALGGRSSERAVSIASGREVVLALEKLGYQTAILDVGSGKLLQTPEIDLLEKDAQKMPRVANLPLIDIKRHFELVFIAMHGRFGEDGGLQAIFQENGIRYTGSTPLPSALAMDKEFSKKILQASGVAVLETKVAERENEKSPLPFPVVIKPVNQGSSVGVCICENEADFSLGLKRSLEFCKRAIIEPYIKGKELTCAVLESESGEPRALPVIEIIPNSKFFDYKAKYDGTTQEIVPAKIDDQLAKSVQEIAVKAHRLLSCRHFSRVDMVVDQNSNIFVLEVNSIPGLTSESLFPKAAKAGGFDFEKLIDHIVKIALKR
ncbi:MAG: D-alanine--D-alanine ligase [candidate division WS2 bacterium ADurb.Bin280]|uniref:D-alanine--D-alanine ligase n=1 Tax=candidate division WS2 bacterium ADurb.Bin280 TaxID=1852829 RepID=A0A1V5SBX0_9BACT|nr:MAG: D-alanine--D-alanine ligase [candidate division WS2 bacterium ADurb.Bin280]